MTVALRHGVSGVGGSNPLVPIKILLKNQPFMAVFLCLFFIRGIVGVKPGNYESERGEDFAQRLLGHKNLIMTKKYLDARGADYVMV